MMSVLYLMCACTLSHTQTHRSCKVFRASEKESGPVARQPQPPCSLVHFKLKDTNTQEKNCGLSRLPIVRCLNGTDDSCESSLSHTAVYFNPKKSVLEIHLYHECATYKAICMSDHVTFDPKLVSFLIPLCQQLRFILFVPLIWWAHKADLKCFSFFGTFGMAWFLSSSLFALLYFEHSKCPFFWPLSSPFVCRQRTCCWTQTWTSK